MQKTGHAGPNRHTGEKRNPVPIASLLSGLSSGPKWQRRFERGILWREWPQIAGDAISDHAWPLKFVEGDVLVVTVSDTIWMQQLYLQKLMLIDAVNARLSPESCIRDIRFELGNLEETMRSTRSSRVRRKETGKTARQRCSGSEPPPELVKQAEALTGHVKDQELKKILKRIYLKSRKASGNASAQKTQPPAPVKPWGS